MLVPAVPTSIVNLTVHGIGRARRRLESDEAGTWLNVRQFEQVLDAAMGRPDVRLTFDDGNSSDVEYALPRLLDRGLTAEFFVLAGVLGQDGRLDAGGVRELVRAGMSIGSHGWAHRDWRRLDAGQVTEEIPDALGLLGVLTGRPVSTVAIPFGSYDRHVIRRLRQAGVTRAYTSDGGRARSDWWLQPRNSLRDDLEATRIGRLLDDSLPVPVRARKLAARTVKRMRG